MSKPLINIACVQMCSSDEVAQNIEAASALIREAHAQGAAFIATPEMTSLMDRRAGALEQKARKENGDLALAAFRALARELEIWLLLGSLPIQLQNEKCANRSFLINPKGDVAARYDKIHMFDVSLSKGHVYRESENYQAGSESILVDLLGAKIGLSVCYDIRFAQLYRRLAQAGADILMVPSAFTRITGEAHWHVLLRARAIETGSFVVAPAQGGRHADGRETYGHSIIISPWGEVLAEAGTEPGIIHAKLDLAEVDEARARIPSLSHDRIFTGP